MEWEALKAYVVNLMSDLLKTCSNSLSLGSQAEKKGKVEKAEVGGIGGLGGKNPNPNPL